MSIRKAPGVGAVVTAVALALALSIGNASGQSAAGARSFGDNPRGKSHLKSGGLESQLSESEASVSSSNASSRRNGPVEWAQNVNVFPNTNEQDEPTIAVNPASPDNVVVGNHERQGPAAPAAIVCVSQRSTDSGATWGNHNAMPLQGPVFPASGGHSCSDSVLAADAGGNFYFAYLDLFRFTNPLRVDVLVAKSTDGGATFPSFTLVAKGAGSGVGAEDPDKEWIETDRNAQSPYKGNVYVTYTDFSNFTIKFRKSTDGGASFQPPPTSFGTVVSDFGFQNVSSPYACGTDTCLDVTTRYMQGSYVVVGPKGQIYVFYDDSTEIETFDVTTGFDFVNAQMVAAKIMVAKSTDGGATWTRTVVRDMCSGGPCRSAGTDSHEQSNTPPIRVGTNPAAGAGPNGKDVYAVWTEWNSVVFDFDPGSNRDFGVSDGNIMFAHSGDGGATWDSAVRVNDDTGTNDQFFPAMAAGPGNQVHVTWNDRRNDPSNISYEVFYASLNGKSFSGNTPVTTASSNPTGTNFIGDYNDLDQAGGAQNVHAVWTDRRNVTSPVGSRGNDVFTARKRGP